MHVIVFSRYFEGWYYKTVLEPDGERSLVFIPGLLSEPEDGADGFGFVIVVDSAAHASRRARLYRYPADSTGPAEPREGEGGCELHTNFATSRFCGCF